MGAQSDRTGSRSTRQPNFKNDRTSDAPEWNIFAVSIAFILLFQ